MPVCVHACMCLCAASVIIILHCHIMWNNSPLLLLYQVASTHLQDKCLLTCSSVYTILFATQERFWTDSRVASPLTRYKSVRPSHKGYKNLVKNNDLVWTLYVQWYCHYLQESFPAVLGETNTTFGVCLLKFVMYFTFIFCCDFAVLHASSIFYKSIYFFGHLVKQKGFFLNLLGCVNKTSVAYLLENIFLQNCLCMQINGDIYIKYLY